MMIGVVVLSISTGILFGIFTGLTPGIHVNLVSAVLIGLSAYLYGFMNPVAIACFIIAMSTTHTFLDAVPSVFLGAPDAATALGVLPGHRYLLKGYGLSAVKLTVVGSLAGLVLSIVLFPLFSLMLKVGYSVLKALIPYILVLVVIMMILSDRRPFWALIVFFLAGILGKVVFDSFFLKEPLFPMLSGLFGVSTLLISFFDNDHIPLQKIKTSTLIKPLLTFKAVIAGLLGGFVTAVMPGLSSAIAVLASSAFVKKLGDYGFMITIGTVGTVNFSLSLVALLVLNKARNGSIIAVQKILSAVTLKEIVIFALVALIAGGIAGVITIKVSTFFSKTITKINYKMLVKSIILFIIILTPIISSWTGLVILAVSTTIGLLPPKLRIRRVHSMGCIILPVILYLL